MPADVAGANYLKGITSVIKADAGDFDVAPGAVGAGKNKARVGSNFAGLAGLSPEHNRDWVLRQKVSQLSSLKLLMIAFEHFRPRRIGIHDQAGGNDGQTFGEDLHRSQQHRGIRNFRRVGLILGERTCHFKISQSAFLEISGCHAQTKALARKHVLGKHQIGAGALSKDVPSPESGSRR